MLQGITFRAHSSSTQSYSASSDFRQPGRDAEHPDREDKYVDVALGRFTRKPCRSFTIKLKSDRSPISTLSVEILIIIASFVATRICEPFDRISYDILKLRLVSKLFNEVALKSFASSTFSAPTVELLLRKESYKMLVTLAENPNLARIIRRINLRTEVAYNTSRGVLHCETQATKEETHRLLRLVPGQAPDWAEQLGAVLSEFPNLDGLLLGDLGLAYYCPDMSHYWAEPCFNSLVSTILDSSMVKTLQLNLMGGSCNLPRYLNAKYAQNLTEIIITVKGSLFERRKYRPSRVRGFRDNNWSMFVGNASSLRKLLVTCTADRRWWHVEDYQRERDFLSGLEVNATTQLRVLALKGFCCPLSCVQGFISRFGKLENLALVDMVLGSGKIRASNLYKYADWPRLFDNLKSTDEKVNIQLRCGTRVTKELWAMNRRRHAQKVVEFAKGMNKDIGRAFTMKDEPMLKINASKEFIHELWR